MDANKLEQIILEQDPKDRLKQLKKLRNKPIIIKDKVHNVLSGRILILGQKYKDEEGRYYFAVNCGEVYPYGKSPVLLLRLDNLKEIYLIS